MESYLGELRNQIVISYLDDIIVYSKTLSGHVEHVRRVFGCPWKHGVKLEARKCKLFHRKVIYLGHVISSNGYSPDLSKLQLQNSPIKYLLQLDMSESYLNLLDSIVNSFKIFLRLHIHYILICTMLYIMMILDIATSAWLIDFCHKVV